MTNLGTKNDIKIVGRLINVDSKIGKRQGNGQDYASVKATVQSLIEGVTREYEIDFFANAVTADGKPNQLYASYIKMDELKGKKVEITGSLREQRYWSSNSNQMVSAQTISGRFIKGTSESAIDEGTFEVGGFLLASAEEKKNKEGQTYRFDVRLGQANYNQTMMNMFTFHIQPDSRDIINGIRSYNTGDTVVLNGQLDWIVKNVTKTTESAFGAGVVKTFVNKQRNFWITGGSNPITSKDDGAYDEALIHDLVNAYKARDVELSAAAKDKSSSVTSTSEEQKVTRRQTSLI